MLKWHGFLGDTTGDTYKRATRREALATPPATKGQEAKWSEAGAAAARRRAREAGVNEFVGMTGGKNAERAAKHFGNMERRKPGI